MSSSFIIPVFIPHMGCPHQCVFCNQVKISGQKEIHKNIVPEIELWLNRYDVESGKGVEIAFFGGSFTALPREVMLEYLQQAQPYLQEGKVQKIRLSTRPDCINKEILEILAYYGVKVIELGVQSLDYNVLQKSHRGHCAQDVYDSVEMIRNYGFDLGLQMMIGLPGDFGPQSLVTALKITDLKPDFVRIYPTILVENTPLEKLYLAGQFVPMTLEQYIQVGAQLQIVFETNGIPIIRMGLQATEDIAYDKMIVPNYHPAFRQLVEGEINYQWISYEIRKHLANKGLKQQLILWVPKAQISNFIGQKKCNLQAWHDMGINLSVKGYCEAAVTIEYSGGEFKANKNKWMEMQLLELAQKTILE